MHTFMKRTAYIQLERTETHYTRYLETRLSLVHHDIKLPWRLQEVRSSTIYKNEEHYNANLFVPSNLLELVMGRDTQKVLYGLYGATRQCKRISPSEDSQRKANKEADEAVASSNEEEREVRNGNVINPYLYTGRNLCCRCLDQLSDFMR